MNLDPGLAGAGSGQSLLHIELQISRLRAPSRQKLDPANHYYKFN